MISENDPPCTPLLHKGGFWGCGAFAIGLLLSLEDSVWSYLWTTQSPHEAPASLTSSAIQLAYHLQYSLQVVCGADDMFGLLLHCFLMFALHTDVAMHGDVHGLINVVVSAATGKK